MNQQRLDVDQAPDLREQIHELERELEVRRDVYPRWIAEERIKGETADYRIECLEAAIEQLKARDTMMPKKDSLA